ncbi:DUF72 domain-containing protein [Guyparkeria halophila]|uniref:DUF72 domain-containing protein n=1 Tax=Guyparkeria halophila TaxID=47960 RepID=A0ABZ0YTZ4_9GAMM|nr:DUF72 domain-containing protein [Guyparkeria halophila]WQH15643.1 DUF72 domain-containing protein [Guyparkeria halophila]
MPTAEWLSFYARHFSSVEINATFYRLPSPETLATWRDAVPADFRFAVKASRYITHLKKLKDPQSSIAAFFERIDRLGDRLGPILFQLPPRWHANIERLSAFLDALPDGYRYAFEFRDPSWWDAAVTDLLAKQGAAFCVFDLDGQTSPFIETADFVYLRWHGAAGPYRGGYSDAQLRSLAQRFRGWLGEGRAIHAYFDNDTEAQAPRDAKRLRAMLATR